MTPGLTLIGGGVRSGKSAFALAQALRDGGRPRFIATAEALDGEMRARIDAHRAERGDRFETLEAPRDLAGALRGCSAGDTVVVDCLTLWLSNLLLDLDRHSRVAARLEELAAVLADAPFRCIIVTNEVGMGVVPDSRLGRQYRDLAGRANQRLAEMADEVFFAAMGIILRLRPEPLAVVRP